MPFSFHPKQEKDVRQLFLSMRTLRKGKTSLAILQGPRGCGKSFMLESICTSIFKSSITRIWRNRDLLQIINQKFRYAEMEAMLYASKLWEPKPDYCVLLLDDIHFEASETALTKLVQWIQRMLEKPTAPISTMIVLTCHDLFHGPAQKFRTLIPYQRKKRKKSKDSNIKESNAFVRTISLYCPKPYILEKFLTQPCLQKDLFYYIQRRKKTQPRLSRMQCVADLIRLCAGDIRQLLLLLREPLASTTLKSQSALQSCVGIFPFVSALYAGGAQSWTPYSISDEDSSDDGPPLAQRLHDHVGSALSQVQRCTQESPERILEFVFENRDLVDRKLSDVGFADEARETHLLRYHQLLSEDWSMHDIIHPYTSSASVDLAIRSTAVRAAQLELESYEIDDSAKVEAPRKSIRYMIHRQQKTREARERILEKCIFKPGQKALFEAQQKNEEVCNVLTRANGQDYLDFLGCVTNQSDANYRNLSDLLQSVPSDDVAMVFPKALRKLPKSGSKLFMPF